MIFALVYEGGTDMSAGFLGLDGDGYLRWVFPAPSMGQSSDQYMILKQFVIEREITKSMAA